MRLMILPMVFVAIALSAEAHSFVQPPRPGPRGPSPAQKALERATKDQDQIRALSAKLKDSLLELNKLRQIPPNDPQYKNVGDLIAKQNLVVLQLASAIYALAQGNGLAAAVVEQRQSLQGLIVNGLPARERQTLLDAGLTLSDVAELSVAIQLYGDEALRSMDPVGQRKQLEVSATQGAKMSTAKVVKIGAGALLIGVDVGSRFIPLLNVVTAFEAISSVAGGMIAISDALSDRPQ